MKKIILLPILAVAMILPPAGSAFAQDWAHGRPYQRSSQYGDHRFQGNLYPRPGAAPMSCLPREVLPVPRPVEDLHYRILDIQGEKISLPTFNEILNMPSFERKEPAITRLKNFLKSPGAIASCRSIEGKHVYKALLLTFDNGTQAVFKPDDKDWASYRHEVFAFYLANFLQLDRVPPTVLFSQEKVYQDNLRRMCGHLLGPLSQSMSSPLPIRGSLQFFIPGAVSNLKVQFSRDKEPSLGVEPYYEKYLKSRALKAFDFLQFNCDRHGHQNLIFVDNKDVWIDNGMGLLSYKKLGNIRGHRPEDHQYCQVMYQLSHRPEQMTKEEKCEYAPPESMVRPLEELVPGSSYLAYLQSSVGISLEQLGELEHRRRILLALHEECFKKKVELAQLAPVILRRPVTAPEVRPIDLGPKSIQMMNVLRGRQMIGARGDQNMLDLHGKKFELLTGNVEGISSKAVVSAGAGAISRELITLDPLNSPILDSRYMVFSREMGKLLSQKNVKLFPGHVFELLTNFIKDRVFPQKGDLEQKVGKLVDDFAKSEDRVRTDFMQTGGSRNPPIIPIDHFINAGIGVCRQHSLVASYFIDRLTKDYPSLLPKGKVFHVREELGKDRGHAWTVYVVADGRKELWHVDTLWGRIGNLQDKNVRQDSLDHDYGKVIMDKVVRRYTGE